jgi:amino acid adenylation domain-containing protein
MTDAFTHEQTRGPAGAGEPAAEDVYVFPLSFAQQRLWFFQQMYPGSSTYNLPVAMRLKGRLDVGHLRAALCEVARRHEVLRTSIDLIDDRPAQLISEEAEIPLPVLDLSAVPAGELEAEARRLATEEVTRAFDLRRGPLLRARVLRLSPEEHVLLLVIHHIISDGWSIGVLMNEVIALYDAYTGGREPALPELPIQYADYAVWQREWLTGDVLEEQLTYWREQLSGAPPVLTLPTDRPRPQVQTLAGAHFEFALPEGLPAGLRQLCRREGVTMFMVLLGAFQALLSRYSGQTDVTVGTPIAGRNRAEVEGLIGFFANTLVLRADLSGEPTFRELLRRVKKTCLGAYAHQEMPLERMVEELQPERSLSHAPLFQVLFALQNTPAESFQLPGLEMSPADLDLTTTAFDLTLNVEEVGEGVYCRLRYNTDLFEPETVRRMAGHYTTLLAAAVDDAERPVAELPLLSEAERRRVLDEWGAGRREPAPDDYVHVLFERQAARAPDGAALAFEGRQLSYAELNRLADRLAQHLRGLGVGPESAVAICVRRSPEMFVGILGVLKAGGAYVPLDPAAPQERVRFVLEDTGATVLLTQRSLAAGLPATRARAVCLDEDYPAGGDDAHAAGAGGGSAPTALSPDNLAYVIYTSGSTGRPKGVMVSHASLANTIHARFAQTRERVAGTLLQMSYVFDGSLLSIFCALTQGGVLVIPREGQQSDPAAAAELIAAGRIPHLYTVPSFYSLLLEQARPGQLDSLRVVTVGAEVCTPQLIGEHQRVLPRARLFNEYGPTEATVYCAAHECRAEDAARAYVPVGRPTCNMHLYVLDRHLQPVPVGVSGGLYVGGPGVARGYLNHPGLTAESFIPHPFGTEPGARLYRTGDLARHEADGSIVFLGRLDSQVKIRGYRIELEEIEAALGECRAVRQAAAAVREDAPGDGRLVAYLVAEAGPEPTAEDLREHLRARLPDYMVPSAFVFVDELPRTPAGKVDRRALPSAGGERPRMAGDYAEPRSALERLLAETWREILGVERVGAHDNFFDLGGDSLRAAILVNKLQQRLGDFVYVVALFEAPTVAALAAYLTEHYSAAVSRLVGDEEGGPWPVAGADEGSSRSVNAAALARVREVIGVAPAAPTPAAKNPPAVFVLSPPRSGSTLLRVMLAGHPLLFAPPELELLSFNTLAERREALSGKYSFWLEGTVRAVMEVKGCGMEEARRLMEECEGRDLSVPQFYGLMQEWVGGRTLVDKTPSYALDKEVLRRAENWFDGALYVHLLRHPYGMIRSFGEAKLEQVFFRYRHSFSRRELAELIWLVSQQNIAEFLSGVPAGRQHRLRFEELVSSPREVLEGLCGFLGIEFHPAMVEPYRHQEGRMTDGIHPLSQMLGDVKFHQHSRVDAAVAERWRGQAADDPLAEVTWDAAEALGYQRERANGRPATRAGSPEPAAASPLLVAIQPRGHLPPFFCVHPVGGSPFCYLDLSRRLGPEQPLYGLRAPELTRGGEPHADVETMAADYVEAVRAAQPSGPYRLGGWSLGGVVAFEMARQLQARGEAVAALVMFDTYAPELLGDEFHPRAGGATREGDDADPLASEGVLNALDELCRAGTEEDIKDAFETATRVGLLPPEVGPREFTNWLRGCRSRIGAARAYRPRRFAGRITLFRPSERHDGDGRPPDGGENLDSALGWGGLAAEGVEVYAVPGTHLGMIQEPHVSSLASRLKRILA